jgi:hypothetical protein
MLSCLSRCSCARGGPGYSAFSPWAPLRLPRAPQMRQPRPFRRSRASRCDGHRSTAPARTRSTFLWRPACRSARSRFPRTSTRDKSRLLYNAIAPVAVFLDPDPLRLPDVELDLLHRKCSLVRALELFIEPKTADAAPNRRNTDRDPTIAFLILRLSGANTVPECEAFANDIGHTEHQQRRLGAVRWPEARLHKAYIKYV